MVLLDSLDVQRALRLGLTGVSHGRVDDDQVCWSRVGLHVAGGRASRPLCSHDDAWCLSQVDIALCVPNIHTLCLCILIIFSYLYKTFGQSTQLQIIPQPRIVFLKLCRIFHLASNHRHSKIRSLMTNECSV